MDEFMKALPRLIMSTTMSDSIRQSMRSNILKYSATRETFTKRAFVQLLAFSFDSREKEVREVLRMQQFGKENHGNRDRVTFQSLLERIESFGTILDVKTNFALRAMGSLLRENPTLISPRVLKSLGSISILPRLYREGNRDVPKISLRVCEEASEVLFRLGRRAVNIEDLILKCQDNVETMHALAEIVRGCQRFSREDCIVNLVLSSSYRYEAMRLLIYFLHKNQNKLTSRKHSLRIILKCISELATEKSLIDRDTLRKEFHEECNRTLPVILHSNNSAEMIQRKSLEILRLLGGNDGITSFLSRNFKRLLLLVDDSDRDDDDAVVDEDTSPPLSDHLVFVWLVLYTDETSLNQEVLQMILPKLLRLVASIHTSRVVLGVVGLSSVIRKITPTVLRWHATSISETLLKSLWNKDAVALEPLVQCTLRVVVALGETGVRLQDRLAERLISTLRLSDNADVQTLYLRAVQPLSMLMGARVSTHFSNLVPLLCAAASRESYGRSDRYQAQLEALRSIRCVIRACPVRVLRRHRRKCILAAAKAFYQDECIDTVRDAATSLCRDLKCESELRESGLSEMLK